MCAWGAAPLSKLIAALYMHLCGWMFLCTYIYLSMSPSLSGWGVDSGCLLVCLFVSARPACANISSDFLFSQLSISHCHPQPFFCLVACNGGGVWDVWCGWSICQRLFYSYFLYMQMCVHSLSTNQRHIHPKPIAESRHQILLSFVHIFVYTPILI